MTPAPHQAHNGEPQPRSLAPSAVLFKNSAALFGLCCVLLASAGCEVNSFFDPSRTGRFQWEPTTIPVLERIDVIEQKQTQWAQTSPPTYDDLLPNELAYRLTPGDVVTVGIYELFAPGEWSQATRRLDPSGKLRVQGIGDIPAAGLTAQQLEDKIVALLEEQVMRNPQVDVVVEQGGGLRYTIYGYIQNAGLFTLQNPDLHILEALSLAGGAPLSTERIYVIRRIPLSEEMKPSYERSDQMEPEAPRPATTRPAVDIEELIKDLEKEPSERPQEMGEPPSPPEPPTTNPGMYQDKTEPPVDIDQLEPVRVQPQTPPVDVDVLTPRGQATQPGAEDAFIFVPERGEWVRVRRPGEAAPVQPPTAEPFPPAEPQMIVERVIVIDYERLVHGDSSQNIVVRPGDNIYVDGPPTGFVYIDGEIQRPGVYSLPGAGRLTLSRLVAAAGGLNTIAIPERVDLIRKIAFNREATIRLDLGAIRQRTEPDLMLKPDDHVIIGTSWFATPLAIIRNGFRATYGFGFLLDRNFGPDVFGPEPVNNQFF